MVAKQTKGRRASSRKAKADPVERARAEVAQGVAQRDPVFAALAAHKAAHHTMVSNPEFGDNEEEFDAERAAYRALLATTPTTDAGRLAYALAVIENEADTDGHGHPQEDSTHPLAVAFRTLRDAVEPAHATSPQDAASIEFEPVAGIDRLERAEWDGLCGAHFERVALAFDLLGKSKAELMRKWAVEPAAEGAAAAIERARDWLADTAAAVDEAFARFLVAGAAANHPADAPQEGAAA